MGALEALRSQLASAFAWGEAHADFDDAVKGLPVKLRGRRPTRFPHSPWELVEHIRLAQDDLLDFCRNPKYTPKRWPEDYWPSDPAPRSARAWTTSLAECRRTRAGLQALVTDPSLDLSDRIPHGTGQTYAREVLLALDHTAYHVGQLIVVRRLLGAWPAR